MTYNPFEKEIGESLHKEDLNILITRQVSEGYYVEYKREMPKPTKIARSLASLANTYGGWYIVGVETDEHNVAKAVSGFTSASCHDPISVVRDLVKHHIDPVPIFFPQVITLDNGNLVLTIYIPHRQETPFITKDGRLYRRTYDSSDPVPETSRYALDQLIERGKEVSKRFASFSKDEQGSNLRWDSLPYKCFSLLLMEQAFQPSR
jgi:predicted HTH transcriptional regulator